ncbi:MAG: sigma 54-interacting transcriptional regulator [Planctomycetota bacterium]|nr:sigma 54-interacting transcriptional regulator [Planctomycetota bacterium]
MRREDDAPLEREFAALRRLRDVQGLLAQEPDPRRLVALVLDQAIHLLGAERGFVLLAGSGASPQFDVVEARNLDLEEIRDPAHKFSQSIVQRVVQSGRAEVHSDAEAEQSTRDIPSVRDMQLRSILCAPLLAHGRSVGAVYLDHRHVKRRFDDLDLELLTAFAAPAAIALWAARREAELQRGHAELTRRLATIERLRAELAERYRAASREADRLRGRRDAAPATATEGTPTLAGAIVRSARMQRVLETAHRVARADAPVLVTGEAGTGKELVARALHLWSGRGGPFVAESCAALTDTLLESELFGHEPGAFTGAVRAHAGLFEAAKGGTLLLDEVGEMSPALQAKLLRVLQEREVRRVGGEGRIAVDARVVAATHRDLEAMVARGEFRADLYYRLNVVRLEVPPLRERLEDVPALLDHFLVEHGGGRVRLEPLTREMLLAHPWPGNVRELENEVRRLVVLAGAEGVVRPGLLSPAVVGRPSPRGSEVAEAPGDEEERPITGVWRLEDLEREMLLRALRRARGNKTLAARLLGLAKTSLYHRLARHGLEQEASVQPRSATGDAAP